MLVVVTSAQAQISETQARELARNSVQSRTGIEIWSVHRKEDVEERLRSIARSSKDNPGFIFLLSDEGYEFRENGFATHLPSEGPIFWYVAVLPSSGQVFEMDSREGFNKLAASLHVVIGDESSASTCLDLYLDLHPEKHLLDEVVRTPLQAKQMAENQFTRAYDDFQTAETAFDQWWKQNSETFAPVSLHETFKKVDRGFVSKFYIVSGISKKELKNGPELLEVSLPISRDGQMGEVKLTPVARTQSAQ